MKRRGRLFALILIFSCILVSLSSAYEQNMTSTFSTSFDSASLQMVSLKYDPYPVEPGEQFTLWVKIQNMGGGIAPDARCRVIEDNPFSIYQGESEKDYGALGAKDFAVLDFSLKVNQSAIAGNNELSVECTTDPVHGMWSKNKIMIMVQTRYPTLNIINVKTIPQFVEPGKSAQLLISLENMADSNMKDIDVKLDFSSDSLAPYGEMGEKKLRQLGAGEISDLIFNIVALPNAVGGYYKLPLTLTYTNSIGEQYSMSGTIGVEINSEPELEAYVDSTTLTTGSRTGKVVIKVVNKGLTDLKFMNAKLLDDKSIKKLSSDTIYVGKVDSDDFETLDYMITAKGNTIKLPLNLEYKDVNNGEHNASFAITYNLASSSELSGSKANWWVIAIILIVAVVIFIKRKAIFERIGKFRK